MANYPPLYEFALVTDINSRLQNLADMAQPENWDYRYMPSNRPLPILFNYIHYTFARLKEENKVVITPNKAAFNTGLVTENQEEIHAVFTLNKNPPPQWYLRGFFKASDPELMELSALPELANYFTEPTDLLYDIRLPLRIDLDHIVDENLDRFPREFIDSHMRRTILLGAIEDTKQRIKRNYKTAVPQFYQGNIQLLLPLCLTSQSHADLAMVVYRQRNPQGDVYRASTCLTLDMAYSNARLLARPSSDWLEM